MGLSTLSRWVCSCIYHEKELVALCGSSYIQEQIEFENQKRKSLIQMNFNDLNDAL